MSSAIIIAALTLFICLIVLFAVAWIIKDNSIIDVFWGIGFVIVCGTALAFSDITAKKTLVTLLVAIWAFRLSFHILIRNKGKGEDFRYKAWRNEWKNFRVRSFFQIFMLQGAILLVVASPLLLIIASPSEDLGFLTILGALIFLGGFLLETISDWQLMKFRSNPENKGNLIETGCWKYSRHPNYLGEAILWWGLWICAIPEVNGLFTIISPLIITLLLRYVSGVPMLERKYQGRPDWEAYCQRVPVFLPNFWKGKK
ncbi:MAG: DUF1295 domain-containing protein [Bacteroidales bacterium]|nr:DUF1295 domain-containing protein [Bacteroidales bacterium]